MLANCVRTCPRHAVRSLARPALHSHNVAVFKGAAVRTPVARRIVRSVASTSLNEVQVAELTSQLRSLESERDEAVKTAESCARTAVRLEEMVGLLEQLALSKVKDGDEDSARSVLQEKAAVAEVLGRSQQRAHTNFALAAKLAEKIGGLQRTLVGSLGAPTASTTTTTTSTTSTSTPPPKSSSSSNAGPVPSSSSASSSTNAPRLAPWEVSLADAQQRIRQAEAAAAAAGAAAAASSRETIEEARSRLRAQAESSVSAAQSRIRYTTTSSLEAARARLAAQEAEALSQVRQLVGRYRAGGYVSEDELDWAFRVLERRANSSLY